MSDKIHKKQHVSRRRPQQERAQQKVGLILEAATRLLERGTIDALTTNAIAETAGVSIGTLYQYFDDKDAILEALADREMAGVSERVMAVLTGEPPDVAGGRVGIIINALLSAYGGRRGAHRLLLEHALTRRTPSRLSPLYQAIVQLFATKGVAMPGKERKPLAEAEAFVLTHAVSGVLRALVATGERAPPRKDVELALTQMLVGFLLKA